VSNLSIPVGLSTYHQVTLLAQAWELTPGQAVQRLVEHLRHPALQQPATGDETVTRDHVPVHALYERTRITGQYHPGTRSLTITDGPATGAYKSPSGAAMAVVKALRPDLTGNRSGWDFWRIDASGHHLRTLRHP
jgi:hypothetical protein